MDKSRLNPLELGGISITHCPSLDPKNVSMVVDCRYDDCRILEVMLNDGRGFRIDDRTSNIDIDEVLIWVRGSK
jgi:hypothetical protein